jgi:excisionase family DNA binding protein
MSDELISPRQAAEIAHCHEDTIRRAIEFGYLPAQRVGKTWAIKPDDVHAWIDAGKPNHRRKSTRKEAKQPTNSVNAKPDDTGGSQ